MDRPIAIHLNPMNLPKLNVTDVLIDVIRFPTRKLKRVGGVGFFRTLTEIVAAQQSVLIKERALAQIREVGDPKT